MTFRQPLLASPCVDLATLPPSFALNDGSGTLVTRNHERLQLVCADAPSPRGDAARGALRDRPRLARLACAAPRQPGRARCSPRAPGRAASVAEGEPERALELDLPAVPESCPEARSWVRAVLVAGAGGQGANGPAVSGGGGKTGGARHPG